MLNLLKELKIRDRLQWAPHRMSFAMRQNPGQFTNFEFPANVPAPFNMAAAILTNREMLSLVDKIKMVPGLLPMLIEGQDFIDAQDELSVLEFMEKYGMPETVNEEIFIAMAKALDFTDPDRMSMTVILTAMNRFINEADGSQTAFLDGTQPDRVCAPIAEHVRAAGGLCIAVVVVMASFTSGVFVLLLEIFVGLASFTACLVAVDKLYLFYARSLIRIRATRSRMLTRSFHPTGHRFLQAAGAVVPAVHGFVR